MADQRTSATQKPSTPNIVGSHYKVLRKIGEGSFGIIYEGILLLTKALTLLLTKARYC